MVKVTKRNNLFKEKSDDEKISIALMTSFVILTIQYFILITFNLLGTTSASLVQLISKVIVGLIYIYALPAVLRKSSKAFISVYFIAVFIFLINSIVHPENNAYIASVIFPFFFMCLPTFVYSFSLDKWNILKQIMKKSSFIVFIFGIIIGVLIISGTSEVGEYSMSLSYYMLLPAIIFIDEFYDKPTVRMLVFTFLSVMIILALGSRGAILCIAVFVALRTLTTFYSKLNYTKLFTYISGFGVITFLILNFDNILTAIYNFLLKFGIESRSIVLFLREDIYLSGRDKIYNIVYEEMLMNPILGLGIAGDGRVLNGGYAHNLFLQLLSNFGIVFGLILSILLILLIFISLLNISKDKHNIIIIWISIGFAHMMISSSYLIDMKFWLFMGLIIKGQLICRTKF